MDFETVSMTAIFTGLAVGIMAIVLSIVFYKMSSQVSESTKEAARGISASVERLEKLFDRLYADTFSMMRETVSDMRKHIWPETTAGKGKIAEEAEGIADKKVDILKQDIDAELSRLLQKQTKTDAKVDTIRGDLRKLIDRAITESRKVDIEAREQTLRETIIDQLKSTPKHKLEAVDLVIDRVEKRFPYVALKKVLAELQGMKQEGILAWEGKLEPDTVIELKS